MLQTPLQVASIELTHQEAQALVNLIDIATKALGLKVANDAIFFNQKIDAAFFPQQESAITPTKPEE